MTEAPYLNTVIIIRGIPTTIEEWRELPTLRFRSYNDLMGLQSSPPCPGVMSLARSANAPFVVVVANYRRRDIYRPIIRVPMGVQR